MATREWDASSYDALPLPHVEWGKRTISRLKLTGRERVLDAGCGTGRDGAELLRQYPDVDLVGIDGSSQMIAQAWERLGDRAALEVHDLLEPLTDLEHLGRGGLFDAVMSVACFHWIDDHARLFANLAAVMRPGAKLITDCGGQGNIDNVEIGIAAVQGVPHQPKTFASPQDTRRHLEAAGFSVNDVSLRPDPLRIEDPTLMEHYLATVCLGGYLADLSDDDGRTFTHAVREAMPEPVLDYVRLEIEAIRS